jgi:hypothetical protein
MKTIFLKSKINWPSLIGLLGGSTLFFWAFAINNDKAELVFASILICIALIDQAIYIWRWSTQPLLEIDNDSLYINKIGTFYISEIKYIEIRRSSEDYDTWPPKILAIKFNSEHAHDLLRSAQKEFFTLVRAPFSIADFTVKINKELSVPWKEIESLIEEKISANK